MSAPEQPQGVLLRYAGGEVYALARPVVGLVWDLAVAGAVLRCRMDGSAIPEGAWLRVKVDLATLAALPMVHRRVDVMTAARDTEEAIRRLAAATAEHVRAAIGGVGAACARVVLPKREAAEHARVALEMERTPQRPTKAKRVAKRTGKAKGRAKR